MFFLVWLVDRWSVKECFTVVKRNPHKSSQFVGHDVSHDVSHGGTYGKAAPMLILDRFVAM